MSLESVTQEWMQQLTRVGGVYTLAAISKAGLLDAYYGGIISLYEATQGGLMYTGAATGSFALTAGLPVVTAVGVWVALGSGYYQARQEAKSEESMSGFSQGFVMAILGWRWNQVATRFSRPYISINAFDSEMDSIRVNSYHAGLKAGFLDGVALPSDGKKSFSRVLRKAGNVHGPKEWSRDSDISRNQQISYVIDMASAGRRYNLIRSE